MAKVKAKAKAKKNNVVRRGFDNWKAWIYLAPALILLIIFTVWPIFNTVRMAFSVYSVEGEIYDPETLEYLGTGVVWKGFTLAEEIGGRKFVFGLQNFEKVITTGDFATVLKNTLILCIFTVPISTLLALIIAVCLNSIKPLSKFLQTIYFLPYVTNSIAIGMVFTSMFNIVGLKSAEPSYGIINEILSPLFLGIGDLLEKMLGEGYINAIGTPLTDFYNTASGTLQSIMGTDVLGFIFGESFGPSIIPTLTNMFEHGFINWINQGSQLWANYAVLIIYIIWNALPFKILILLGGLQSVNKQYYDAAKIDSTPKWRVFTKITVPLLSPMISYVLITGFIGGFKEYTSIVGIFGEKMQAAGAAVGTVRLQTMVGYIYDQLGNAEGVASAAAILLFFLIFAVTLVNLAVSKKTTYY